MGRETSRTKKSFYNIISKTILLAITTLSGLILPRFILKSFGSSYNGLISSISQFLEYIGYLTLGVAGSTRVALYKSFAKDDIYATSAILKSHRNYMKRVGYALIVYTFVLAIAFSIFKREEFSWVEVTSLVLVMSVSTMAEYFYGNTANTFLMAKQSQFINNIVLSIVKVLSTVISIILILSNNTIQVVKLGSAICVALGRVLLNVYVYRKYNIKTDVEPDNSALEQRGDVAAITIANSIHSRIDVFLLTLFSDLKTVSVYTVYSLVTVSLTELQQIFTTGLEGAFGELWARGNMVKFKRHFVTFEYIMYAFSSVIFTCAWVLIIPFVSIYTRGVEDTEYILPVFAFLSVLACATAAIRSPYKVIVQAAGKYKETRNGAIVEAGLNLVISFVGVFKLGLVGVTLGTVVANLFRTIQYATYASKELVARSYWKLVKRTIWLLGNWGISYIVIKLLLKTISINSWIYWIICAAASFVISGIVTFITSILAYRDDFLASRSLLTEMIRKR